MTPTTYHPSVTTPFCRIATRLDARKWGTIRFPRKLAIDTVLIGGVWQVPVRGNDGGAAPAMIGGAQ